MKLNVEIESDAIGKVITDGIKSLSPEELGTILKQVVYEAFTKCDEFKGLLLEMQTTGWHSELTLGKLAREAIGSVADQMMVELAPFRERMVRALVENHQRILEDMLLRLLSERIAKSGEYLSELQMAVHDAMERERNSPQ
jgi:hypothetical protein